MVRHDGHDLCIPGGHPVFRRDSMRLRSDPASAVSSPAGRMPPACGAMGTSPVVTVTVGTVHRRARVPSEGSDPLYRPTRGRRRLRLAAALSATTVLTVSACIPADDGRVGTGTEVPSPAQATVSTLTRTGEPALMPRPHPEELPREPSTAYPDVDRPQGSRTPAAEPSWDRTSREEATETALQALLLFARPHIRKEQWWEELSPRLSVEGRQAYLGVDPGNITVTTVTGSPVLADSTSPYLAEVSLETDDGIWKVLISRETAGQPWAVERFMPPGPGTD
jgi:hypothetical protein